MSVDKKRLDRRKNDEKSENICQNYNSRILKYMSVCFSLTLDLIHFSLDIQSSMERLLFFDVSYRLRNSERKKKLLSYADTLN